MEFERIGAYVVEKQLATGGMARVLKATAPDGSPVVLKVPLRDNPETIVRFRDEGRIGMRVNHPAIVRTVECFDYADFPVIVLEFIDGQSLEDLIKQAPIGPEATAYLGSVIGDALAAIHRATDEDGRELHIVHRDISPANILVERAGTPVLIDLGIARSDEAEHKTKTGILLGTLPYLAPELLSDGGTPSPSSDLWALGCVLYECLTGERLYAGPQARVLGQLVKPDPVPHDKIKAQPPAFQKLLQKLIVADRRGRMSDGRQVASMLATLTPGQAGRKELAGRVTDNLGQEEFPRPITPSKIPRPVFSTDEVQRRLRPDPEGPYLDGGAPPRPPTPAGGIGGLSPADGLPVLAPLGAGSEDLPPLRTPRPTPPPIPDESLELAHDPYEARTARGRFASADDGDARDYYPTPAKKRGSPMRFLAGLTVVALVIGIGIALFVRSRKAPGEDDDRLDDLRREAARLQLDAERRAEELLRHERPPRAPKCWTQDYGYFFVYKDRRGTQTVKERILDVPRRYRRKARCVKKDQ